MTTLIVRGYDDNGETIEEPFEIPDGMIPDWKRIVRLHAIEALWEARWTPGSVAWGVFTTDGIDLRIGEGLSD